MTITIFASITCTHIRLFITFSLFYSCDIVMSYLCDIVMSYSCDIVMTTYFYLATHNIKDDNHSLEIWITRKS